MKIAALLYREPEWNPDLLDENMKRAIPAYSIAERAERESLAGEIAKALTEHGLRSEDVLVIAATDETICAAKALGIAVTAYSNPDFPGQTYEGVPMVIEGFEEVDIEFLERIFDRCHGIPWVIARTERCVIREFAMDDLEALVKLYDQPGVTYRIDGKGQRIPGFIEPLFPMEQEREYQEAYIANMYGYYGYGMWLVVDAGTGELIGRAGLEHREFEDGVELEMGYVMAPKRQRQGYAAEVCTVIMDYAKRNLDFPRVNALTDEDNAASIALLKKLGFRYLEDTDVTGSRTRRYVYYFYN